MVQNIIRLADLEKATGLSKGTTYRLIRKGKFPKPINLGTRAVGWIEDDIAAWQAARIAERDEVA